MLNFVKKSKYHQTAGSYSLAGYRVKGGFRFLLWQNKKILGAFDTAGEAQQYANELEREAA